MSSHRLTMIFSYRDREIDRVKRSLESLIIQTCKDFCVNFVDYGSQPRNAHSVRELTESFEFCSYFYSDTRGHPWNRSRALNIGIRRSQTEFVLTSDVDMIFAPNFVETVLNAQDGHAVIHCAPHWLPESFTNWETLASDCNEFPVGDRAQRGGCQCAPYKAMMEIEGLDESYEYWGAEDRDLHRRLMQLGLTEFWVNEDTSIYHQWHPAEQGDVPRGYAQRWVQPYLQRVGGELTRNNSSWGLIVTQDERQIFALLPEANTGKVVDWQTLLVRIPRATSVPEASPYWILTDCATSPFITDVIPTSYQRVIINAPSPLYLLRQDGQKEREVENHFASALENSAHGQTLPPKVIVIYVPTFWRISTNLFQCLMDLLAPGGVLTVANTRQPRLPLSWRRWRMLLPALLEWLCPRLWRLSPGATYQCRDVLAALRAPNDLCDSLYLARAGATGISDFTLDFPVLGGAAVFLKSL